MSDAAGATNQVLALVSAAAGGGVFGHLITAIAGRRKAGAEAHKTDAEARKVNSEADSIDVDSLSKGYAAELAALRARVSYLETKLWEVMQAESQCRERAAVLQTRLEAIEKRMGKHDGS